MSLRFRKPKQNTGGAVVTFDVGTTDYDDEANIRRVLRDAIDEGEFGSEPFYITDEDFEFQKLPFSGS